MYSLEWSALLDYYCKTDVKMQTWMWFLESWSYRGSHSSQAGQHATSGTADTSSHSWQTPQRATSTTDVTSSHPRQHTTSTLDVKISEAWHPTSTVEVTGSRNDHMWQTQQNTTVASTNDVTGSSAWHTQQQHPTSTTDVSSSAVNEPTYSAGTELLLVF